MRRYVQHNFWYKVAALAIATFVWSHVRSTQNPVEKKIVEVPLTFVNYPRTLEVTRSPSSVRFTVSGHREEIEKLRPSDIKAQVDFAGASPGLHAFKISYVLPTWVNVSDVEMDPRNATVELEEILSRVFDIQINPEGTPPRGYTMSSPEFDPKQVVVSGRSSLVEKVRIVFGKVSVSDRTASISDEVTVYPVDRLGIRVPGLKANPSVIPVRINVSQTETSKSVAISPRVVGRPAAGYEIEEIAVEPLTVLVLGPPVKLRDIQSVVTAQIDISGATASTSREIALLAPMGLRVGETTARVTVALRRLPPAPGAKREAAPSPPAGGR